MQIKVNSREIDSYAIKKLKTTLADHVGDEYALLLGRRLQEGMAKTSLFN